MNILIAIPARLESSRLPRKLLLAETGKPLIQHTVEAVFATDYDFGIATDSGEVFACLEDTWRNCKRMVYRHRTYGAKFSSGTDRVDDLVRNYDTIGDDTLIINWQADEPELKPEHITELIRCATEIPGCDMATLATIATEDDQHDPNVVKVRRGIGGYATKFSRQPIGGYRHIGIYAYTPAFLRWYVSQPPSANEQRESLEQLRAMDAGCRIRVGLVDHPYRGIDTREDYDAFVKRQKMSICT